MKFFPNPLKEWPPVADMIQLTIYYGERKLHEVVETIIDCLNPNYMIFVDAWFLASTNKTGNATEEKELRMIYPNSWGAINQNKVIIDSDDVEQLLKECNDSTLKEKLIRSHDLNQKIAVSSSLSVHRVVALQITLKKLPYQYGQ